MRAPCTLHEQSKTSARAIKTNRVIQCILINPISNIDSAGVYPSNTCHHTSKPANNFFSVSLSYLRPGTRLDLIVPHAASLVAEKETRELNVSACANWLEIAANIHLIPKWQPINYSFVCALISTFCLINMYKKQKKF